MKIFPHKQSWLLIFFAAVLLLVSFLITIPQRPSPNDILQGNPQSVTIEIEGKIPNPGIYSFPRQVTVEQVLLEACGIGRDKIDNPQGLRRTLKAGSKITVIRNEKRVLAVELARMEPDKCIVFSIPLDLNMVEEEHLTLIPGIGPELARKIIQYRSNKGGFRRIEELMEVRGIGQRKLRSLERYLVVGG
jgi:competence protein ComEA